MYIIHSVAGERLQLLHGLGVGRNVFHPMAATTYKMEVGLPAAVVMHRFIVQPDSADQPHFAQQLQIAIDGAQADVGNLGPGDLIDPVGRRMIRGILHDIENQLALFAMAMLCLIVSNHSYY